MCRTQNDLLLDPYLNPCLDQVRFGCVLLHVFIAIRLLQLYNMISEQLIGLRLLLETLVEVLRLKPTVRTLQ